MLLERLKQVAESSQNRDGASGRPTPMDPRMRDVMQRALQGYSEQSGLDLKQMMSQFQQSGQNPGKNPGDIPPGLIPPELLDPKFFGQNEPEQNGSWQNGSGRGRPPGSQTQSGGGAAPADKSSKLPPAMRSLLERAGISVEDF